MQVSKTWLAVNCLGQAFADNKAAPLVLIHDWVSAAITIKRNGLVTIADACCLKEVGAEVIFTAIRGLPKGVEVSLDFSSSNMSYFFLGDAGDTVITDKIPCFMKRTVEEAEISYPPFPSVYQKQYLQYLRDERNGDQFIGPVSQQGIQQHALENH